MNRAFEGRTGRAFVGQLSEDKALQNAGKLASEAFIMTVRSLAAACTALLLCWPPFIGTCLPVLPAV